MTRRFKSDKQRRAVMANLNSNNVTITPGFRRIRVTKTTTKREISKYLNSVTKSNAYKSLSPKERERVNKALIELRKAKTSAKVKLWVAKHDKFFTSVGLLGGGLLIVSAGALPVAGVTPKSSTILTLGVGGALSTAGWLGRGVNSLENPKAKKLFIDRKRNQLTLIRKGYTPKQARLLVKSKILKAESGR